jgi:hypothetical protein
MPIPSKFDLMRWNRELAQTRVAANPIGFTAPAPAPVVPFMEIDGVKYREKGTTTTNGCIGCAFSGLDCADANDAAEKAFGGRCWRRGVIYIRAN